MKTTLDSLTEFTENKERRGELYDALSQYLWKVERQHLQPYEISSVKITDGGNDGPIFYIKVQRRNSKPDIVFVKGVDLLMFMQGWEYSPFLRGRRTKASPLDSNEFKGEPMTELRTWESVRSSVMGLVDPKNHKGRIPSISLDDTGRFTCTCSQKKMCAHIAGILLDMRDRRDFLNRLFLISPGGPSNERKNIQIPIGMGRYLLLVLLRPVLNEDGNRTGDIRVDCHAIPGLDQMVIGKNEGLLPYIKYVEDWLRDTPVFSALIESDVDPGVVLINSACINGRKHGTNVTWKNAEGLRSGRDRENFILGTACSLLVKSRCLPCHDAITGIDDIPDV